MTDTKPPLNILKRRTILKTIGIVSIWVLVFLIIAALVWLGISHVKNVFKYGFWSFAKQFVKQLGIMLLFSLAIVLAVGIVVLFQTLIGKWRSIRVFFSYQHLNSELILELEQVLKNRWIKPQYIPFNKTAEHDITIRNVKRLLKSADLIIVLPGADKSFVDAEILAASTLDKPVIFLKIKDDQTTPDTSYRGYPVFDMNKLKELEFHPLRRFILYVCKSSKDIKLNFVRTLSAFLEKLPTIYVVYFICGLAAELVGPLMSVFKSTESELQVYKYFYWGFTFFAVSFFLVSYVKVVFDRFRAIRITRQKIITGDMTYELLNKCFRDLPKDEQIMDCMLFKSLPLRY